MYLMYDPYWSLTLVAYKNVYHKNVGKHFQTANPKKAKA